MSPHAEQRLSEEGLTRKIAGAAYNVARQYGVDPADVEQEIILAILEQYTKAPDFMSQSDAYIVNRGVWSARNVLAGMARREWNHEVEETEVEAGVSLLDLAGGCDPWASVGLEMALEAAYDELSEVDRGILAGMCEGLTRREIGQAVGLSHTGVNNHIPAIAEAIRAQL